MGECLPKPITTKESVDESNDKLICGMSSMQGWCVRQEGAHNCILDFDTNTSLFAVYDGHGGLEVAEYCSQELPAFIKNVPQYKDGDLEEGLKEAFLGFDRTLLTPEVFRILLKLESLRKDTKLRQCDGDWIVVEEAKPKRDGSEEEDDIDKKYSKEEFYEMVSYMKGGPGRESGCTAVLALLRDNELYVANAGDSRCIVCRNRKAIEMSIDHKPYNKLELERIKKAGGEIEFGLVDGNLNLTRALGDHCYKRNKRLPDREQMITALPDVKKLTINPQEDEFIFLACDGIWDCMSSQQVVDFIRLRLMDGYKPSQICEEMFDQCLSPDSHTTKGSDNMTAMIIKFKPNVKRNISPNGESNSKHAKIESLSDTTV